VSAPFKPAPDDQPSNVDSSDQREFDWADLKAHMLFGVWVVPIVLIFCFVALWVATVVSGWALPEFLRADLLFAWAWINGALMTFTYWVWTRERMPISRQKWIKGRAARRVAIAICALSVAQFVLPQVLVPAVRALISDHRVL
jgi:hypothetical protein